MDNSRTPYDVVIIGGGITGAGAARDCAMRGLKTLLLERARPGGATTAASTHLIHGGLRYLLYDRLTTHLTCWDSGHILRIARPLLTRLPILWPVYSWHSHGLETVETLLESYDRFQPMKDGKPHLRLSAPAVLQLVPALNPEGLQGGLLFDEWWVDPLRLVDANLDSAKRHGALIEAGVAADGLIMEGKSVRGVVAQGREIQARLVLNATGPWVGKIAAWAGAKIALRLRQGTHLIYNRRLAPIGLLLEQTRKGRYIFTVPYDGGSLVGPTDIEVGADPDAIGTSAEEIQQLAQSARFYLRGLPERHDATIVGARPIIGRGGDEKLLSRQYEVFDHQAREGISGFVSIGGGKMSDFRAMAEAATDAVCARLGIKAPCRTHQEALDGSSVTDIADFPKPSAFLRHVLKTRPRLRQFHALAYLGAALIHHKFNRGKIVEDASGILARYGRTS